MAMLATQPCGANRAFKRTSDPAPKLLGSGSQNFTNKGRRFALTKGAKSGLTRALCKTRVKFYKILRYARIRRYRLSAFALIGACDQTFLPLFPIRRLFGIGRIADPAHGLISISKLVIDLMARQKFRCCRQVFLINCDRIHRHTSRQASQSKATNDYFGKCHVLSPTKIRDSKTQWPRRP